MAQPANTFSTYGQVGIREDLSDMIWDISPTEVPFSTMCGKNKATATLHEWQTDELAAAAADNAMIEGDDSVTDAAVPTVRRNNQTQILVKVPRVTETSQAVNTAGRSNEMAYQIGKRTKELKRDLESSLLDNQAKVVGSDTVARRMAGVPAWIATNTSAGLTGADPVGDGSNARTDGTQRAFTEALMTDVLQQCYQSGGDPETLMVGPVNKQRASGFSGNVQRREDAGDKRLTAAIDVYVSDFGVLKIVPNRFQRERDGLVLQKDMWKVSQLRGLANTELAKTGSSVRRKLEMEVTLEACNEAASGIIADLTTA